MNAYFVREQEIRDLEMGLFATEARMRCADVLYKRGSGHTGGSFSSIDIMTSLYHPKHGVMRYDPKNPEWVERDIFVLSAGHKAPALYTILAKCGFFLEEELYALREMGSRLQGHASDKIPGVEASTGSLGQGLSIAKGMALALRLKGIDSMVYCLLGDGETDEGQVWEAARNAVYHELGNLCAIIDYNGLRIDSDTSEVLPIGEKWEAFGWYVIGEDIPWSKTRQQEMEFDGHDYGFLSDSLERAKGRMVLGKPEVIIANTVKAKGIPMMENKRDSHGRAPDEAEYNDAMRYLSELKTRQESWLNELRSR